MNAKTTQERDYLARDPRRSYQRRTASERAFATTTNHGHADLSRGHRRLTGLTPNALFTGTAFITRNLRITDAFHARQADNQRRARHGLPPRPQPHHPQPPVTTSPRPPTTTTPEAPIPAHSPANTLAPNPSATNVNMKRGQT